MISNCELVDSIRVFLIRFAIASNDDITCSECGYSGNLKDWGYIESNHAYCPSCFAENEWLSNYYGSNSIDELIQWIEQEDQEVSD